MSPLIELLSQNGIEYKLVKHAPVFTVETMMQQPELKDQPGQVVKNLFVKDKKAKELWLITVRHDLEFKLTSLAKHLKVKDFRMADEQQMIDLLGVERGCATPMALMNDKDKSVNFIYDADLQNDEVPLVWSHPLVNDHSIGLCPSSFKKFLNSINMPENKIHIVNFNEIS